jgi:transposase
MDKVKDEVKYQKRRQAVEAVQAGNAVVVVARLFQVPQKTLFTWLARYRQGGWHALRDKKRSGRPGKLSAKVVEWLYNAITLGDPRQYQMPFSLWTLAIVRTMLKKHHGITLSKSAVCRLMQQLGLSAQRPVYRSYKQDPGQLREYLTRGFPELGELSKRLGASIYFIDEAAVRSDHHRGTTWAPVGRTPVVEDSGERFGIKLISAVTARGDMRFGCIEGRMNSDKYIAFLGKLLADNKAPIVVIADNAPYHTSQKVRRYALESCGQITLGNLPKYAPELNPDEQVWNHAKARLGRMFIDSEQTMRRLVLNIMRSIQKNTTLIRSFFKLENTNYASL